MPAATATSRAPMNSNLIEKRAHEVWAVMQREVKNRGLALIKDKRFGDGRIMVGTVGAFIKGLGKERDWNLTDPDVDAIRAHLKATGNVVVGAKVEQYRFRIFVRETWSDQPLLPPKDSNRVGPAPEDKVTPEDAGETRAPAPVVWKCADCGKQFVNQHALAGHRATCPAAKRNRTTPDVKSRPRLSPLGEAQRGILAALAAHNGVAEHAKGKTSEVLAERAGLNIRTVTGSLRHLAERGLVERQVHGKRTYKVTLTDAGWDELRKRSVVRSPRRPEPEPAPQPSPEPEAKPEVDVLVHQATPDRLLHELASRLATSQDLEACRQRLDLIRDIVGEVNDGTAAPLKALADIEAAIDL